MHGLKRRKPDANMGGYRGSEQDIRDYKNR